jgi:hypothetical protein
VAGTLSYKQLLFGKCKDFALIDTAKLGIYFQVLFVERLKQRVDESTEQW